ncbi:hypothetical protein AB0C27_21935 [Nonomuraea sp. NPDC048882]|uniref:hypothetical protein n=1 Tax=Nonomuraea sp. NPDC048882 TaxID=3154347 RepID=UPI00340D3339
MGSAAWGDNAQGQLGLGGTQTAHTAAPMPGMTVFSQVSAGGSHTIALAKDGAVWTWGANYYGALGNGTTAPSSYRPRCRGCPVSSMSPRISTAVSPSTPPAHCGLGG